MRTYALRLLFMAAFMFALSVASFGQVSVGISVNIGPPELPVYEQPICPGDGYIWTPGYWAWADGGYFWVPGTWVVAPQVGFLWTPGYWGWGGSAFFFHEGYWGPHIGFYGGINYGFGYTGNGYEGGRWDNGHFFYNRSVNNVNVTVIHNVYNTTIVNNYNVARVSYNGGAGGINARATAEEEAAARDRHVGPIAAQTEHVRAASENRALRASENHGKPPIAATPRPGAFNDREAIGAKEGGRYNSNERPVSDNEAHGNGEAPRTPVHANQITPSRPAAPNTGNASLDRKYQQQQDKLNAKQDQERQNLQKKQDQDHQRMTQQKASEAQKQQVEQRHQQQTQQLAQKHTQQQQHLQQHQPAPKSAPSEKH